MLTKDLETLLTVIKTEIYKLVATPREHTALEMRVERYLKLDDCCRLYVIAVVEVSRKKHAPTFIPN